MSVVVERSFHLADISGRKGGFRRSLCVGAEPTTPAPAPQPVGRVPRIARLMALAIRCEQLLRSGAVPDASALARIAHVSQPRMTQVLNMTLLAPDLQEAILLLQAGSRWAYLGERHLRPIAACVCWDQQRLAWQRLGR